MSHFDGQGLGVFCKITGTEIKCGDYVQAGKNGSVYRIKYYPDYGVFGFEDPNKPTPYPLGHSGSSTRYSPYTFRSFKGYFVLFNSGLWPATPPKSDAT